MRSTWASAAAALGLVVAACTGRAPEPAAPPSPAASAAPSPAPRVQEAAPVPETAPSPSSSAAPAPGTETATFAGGCFWCVEAVLEQIPGVLDARSGYMGGTTPNPTYEQVCSGRSGHAEVVQVTFDPAKVGYDALLEWFWKAHDPTTLNRQGADEGTQYRSAIFVHSDAQRAAAERSKAAAQAQFEDRIVTEIVPASAFTPAEGYHQDYYRGNRAQPYCRAVITPKLKKLGLKE